MTNKATTCHMQKHVLKTIACYFLHTFLHSCFAFFSVLLLMTSCCLVHHLSAADETSNVLKCSEKMFTQEFGCLLYIEATHKN